MSTCSSCTLVNPPNALVCEACSALLSGTACERAALGGYLVTARRLWDGVSDCCVEGECGVGVAVVAGAIAWVGLLELLPESLQSLPATHHFADEDSTLMPGLVDCHVHIEFNPRFGLHEQPQLSEAEQMREMKSRARAMVAHGILTARDLGGRGPALDLRDAIGSSLCVGPRLLCAGQPITKLRGHCHQWGGEAEGVEGIRTVVNRQLAAPTMADVIKVMATGGVRTPGTNPAQAAFSLPELEAVVAAAHAGGRKCAAHAHGVKGIANAVRAGVDTIEHCSWVGVDGRWGQDEAELVHLIAAKGTFVCPTVGAGWVNQPGLRQVMTPALRRMRQQGVRFVSGSDAGAIPNLAHHRLADGIVLLAQMSGMSNAEAMRTATSEAAAALGVDGICGSLIEGLSADLLVCHGNPVLDLENLCAPPLSVVCRGEAVDPCRGPALAPGEQRRSTSGRASESVMAWAQPSGLGTSSKCSCSRL